MKKLLCWGLPGLIWAQAGVAPVVSHRSAGDKVQIVRVAPRFATAIRLTEAVSSVVVGDPDRFLVEHSDKEPMLVLVKPVVAEPADSNLLITTAAGRQLSFLLQATGVTPGPTVDFVVNYRPAASFLVDDTGPWPPHAAEVDPLAMRTRARTNEIDRLLERQQRSPLPKLFGSRTEGPENKGERVRAGVAEVVENGDEVIVLFSVVNPQRRSIEVLAPQVQLAGAVRKGFPVKRTRWATSEQIVVRDYRLSRQKIGPGERADGVLLFNRPGFKQSMQGLFLQVAESGAVDLPALAPIAFGDGASKGSRKEVGDE